MEPESYTSQSYVRYRDTDGKKRLLLSVNARYKNHKAVIQKIHKGG